MSALKFIIIAPCGPSNAFLTPSLAISAARANAIGVIDLEYVTDWRAATQSVECLNDHGMGGGVGVRMRSGCLSKSNEQHSAFSTLVRLGQIHKHSEKPILLLTAGVGTFDAVVLKQDIETARSAGYCILVETIDVKEALLAQECGADAIVGKGHESGGRVGDKTTFVLIQELVRLVRIPVWAQGGIGLRSVAAVQAAGAEGVILDSQLYLCRDSLIPPAVQLRLQQLDGSETVLFNWNGKHQKLRLLNDKRSASQTEMLEPFSTHFSKIEIETTLEENLSASENEKLWLIGQDVCFARELADRFGTVSGVISAMRAAVAENIASAKNHSPLSEGSQLAVSHGTRFPIVQGAMTRVSDNSEFAYQVARAGGLPLLALALMRAGEIEKLLEETTAKLSKLNWGAGMLGFVPQALWHEQLEVVKRHRPPFALIAGGRPDQAKSLEALGIKTYLHVPSPLLLQSFIEVGARRFVFEGKECGGHVGPRSSFILWESMIDVLLAAADSGIDPSEFHLLFAGGIHDELSGAMVASMVTALSGRGMKVGVLVGTAYLFTEEAVSSGAIVQKFQQAAVDCKETVLLDSGPGHSIRCINSPYKQIFDNHREELRKQGKGNDEIREELEMMNLGRLRIASKGLQRAGQNLKAVNAEKQWQDGMYMIGQVAGLHDSVITIEQLHRNISEGSSKILQRIENESPHVTVTPNLEPIAIIGMSCMFPQSNDVETYWQNILGKVNTIKEIPETHFDIDSYYDEDPLTRDKVASKWGGFLEDAIFDPLPYGIPPGSLSSIDPIQLLMLEAAKSALQDAGYTQGKYCRDRASVIIANAGHGPASALYSLRTMLGWKLKFLDRSIQERLLAELPEWTEDTFPGLLGNVIGGRVSNRFDLKGLNFSIDAACASSLAALYVAINDLRAGNSDLVLLGAADTHNQPVDYLSFGKTHALSRKGRCQTFDANADGIVISEGIGMLVLKRLSDAERNGDRIYALVRGIGGSSDGRDLSLTAPRPAGQALALQRAYENAGISPATIGLVEAHGTGTVAGDRAEVEALTQIFSKAGAETGNCAIGSVKTNIGHCKAAAGLASLIKTAKALHHKVLPPTINVSKANPSCRFGENPFYLNTEARPWFHENSQSPRRAGVSAFGFGGTNFHAVLEEYNSPLQDSTKPVLQAWPAELFVFKASSRADLLKQLVSMRLLITGLQAEHHIETSATSKEKNRLFDLAFKLHLKTREQKSFACALSVVATSLSDLSARISSAEEKLQKDDAAEFKLPGGTHFFTAQSGISRAQNNGDDEFSDKVAFLFPGQGSQRLEMLKELSFFFPGIAATLEECDRLLGTRLEPQLTSLIFPIPALSEERKQEQQSLLTRTDYAQPALAACDLAMLKLLRDFGLAPDMVAGHSLGEYAALHAAGVLSESQLLALAAERGRIMQECVATAPGAMAAVSMAAAEVEKLIAKLPGVYIANINAPEQCIISGACAAVDSAIQFFKSRDIICKKIPVGAAFHSPLMEGARKQLKEALTQSDYASPSIPVFSNTTAKPHRHDRETIIALLSDHAIEPVRFSDQLVAMFEAGARIFVEVGPGSVLTGLTDATLKDREFVAVSTERSENALQHFLSFLGLLSVRGKVNDLGKLYWNRINTLPPASASDQKKTQLLFKVNSVSVEKVLREKQLGRPLSISAAAKSKSDEIAQLKVEKASAGKSVPVPAPAPAPVPVPAKSPETPPPKKASKNSQQADSDAQKVVLEFQRSMIEITEQFLKSQETVMLAYLQSQGGETAAHEKIVAQLTGGNSNVDVSMFQSLLKRADNSNEIDEEALQPQDGQPEFGLEDERIAEAEESDLSEETAAASSTEMLIDSLYEIVSQRTGYPREMLDPTLDLEADLGIDSIKRVEILNNFRKLLPPEAQLRVEENIEKLAVTKNIKGIIDWLHSLETAEQQMDSTSDVYNVAGGLDQAALRNDNVARGLDSVARGIVQVKLLEPAVATTMPLSPVTILVGNAHERLQSLQSKLTEIGQTIIVLSPSEFVNDKSVSEQIDRVRRQHGSIGSLLFLASDCKQSFEAPYSELKLLFNLAKELEEDFKRESAAGRRASLILATGLGGAFGIENHNTELDLETLTTHSAMVGFVKSLAREWPEIHVKAVDFQPEHSPDAFSHSLYSELLAQDNDVEIGFHNENRIGLEILESAYENASRLEQKLTPSSVVLVTGGARGITAEIVLEMARRYRCTFVIVGRLPRPSETEASWSRGIDSQKELKAAIMAKMKADGQQFHVRDVEQAYQKLLREREVRNTLFQLQALGSMARYYSVDVRDSESFGNLIDTLYETSNIDGVIQGAGIIEDAYLKNKTMESFSRVFETKVNSALTLAQKVRFDSLQFMYFFSSVVGRTGNAGQTDYVAANEALNKLALRLNNEHSSSIRSIMWGPWQAGMAPPELEAAFASHGWAMIKPEDGRACFGEELERDFSQQAEVVLVGSLPGDSRVGKQSSVSELKLNAPSGVFLHTAKTLELETPTISVTVDTATHRYLLDHKFDGIPVLPMAVALEIMLEAAKTLVGDRYLLRVSKLDIPSGIVFHTPRKEFLVEVKQKSDTTFSLCMMTAGQTNRPHFRCEAEFGSAPAVVPDLWTTPAGIRIPGFISTSGPSESVLDLRNVYGNWMFHGPIFQGIKSLTSIETDVISGEVVGATPQDCLLEYGAGDWILNPVLFDSSMQLAGIWLRHFSDTTALPAGFGTMRFFDSPIIGKESPMRGTAKVYTHTSSLTEISCDLAVYDENGKLFLLVEYLNGIASKSFNRFASQSTVSSSAL